MAACVAEMSGFASILLVLGAVVLAFTLGRISRRERAPRTDADYGDERRELQRLREAGDEILAEIEALGREASARAETRARVLYELLARADRLAAAGGMPGPHADRVADVCRLADEGVDHVDIARRTGLERGEVELVLGLRRARPPEGTEGKPPRP